MDFVFQSGHGTSYRPFRSSFKRAVRKAGLKAFTFHDLRHTFASRQVMKGAGLPTVKKLIGDKKIKMALSTHICPLTIAASC
jgi:site-specific recombinase XerD